jgi:D-inositol-3-phosphate glycosyltransferase
VRSDRVTIIPYGLNNAVPITSLTCEGAKKRLEIQKDEKTILFFGRIAPAKGLDCLLGALFQLRKSGKRYRLIIAGRPDRCEEYWQSLQTETAAFDSDEIIVRANFIPDEDIEIYFKAADVLVLPYRHIYQSGVLFLGQSFGLPVLASDVGSLKEEIVEGETGFIFAPEDPSDLASCIEDYFNSDLYKNLDQRRARIQKYAQEQHSWTTVGAITMNVYSSLLHHIVEPVAQTKAPTSSRKADISL